MLFFSRARMGLYSPCTRFLCACIRIHSRRNLALYSFLGVFKAVPCFCVQRRTAALFLHGLLFAPYVCRVVWPCSGFMGIPPLDQISGSSPFSDPSFRILRFGSFPLFPRALALDCWSFPAQWQSRFRASAIHCLHTPTHVRICIRVCIYARACSLVF